jgi:hypothetical protein
MLPFPIQLQSWNFLGFFAWQLHMKLVQIEGNFSWKWCPGWYVNEICISIIHKATHMTHAGSSNGTVNNYLCYYATVVWEQVNFGDLSIIYGWLFQSENDRD